MFTNCTSLWGEQQFWTTELWLAGNRPVNSWTNADVSDYQAFSHHLSSWCDSARGPNTWQHQQKMVSELAVAALSLSDRWGKSLWDCKSNESFRVFSARLTPRFMVLLNPGPGPNKSHSITVYTEMRHWLTHKGTWSEGQLLSVALLLQNF